VPNPAAKSPSSRTLKRTIDVIWLIAGISLTALLFIGPQDVTCGDVADHFDPMSGLVYVSLLKPWCEPAIWVVGLASMAALLIAGGIALARKLFLRCAVSLTLGLLAFPYVFLVRFFTLGAIWTVCSTHVGPDGATYAFLDSSFAQGSTMALGRSEPDGLLYKSYGILGETNGDSPRSYALLVRPTDKVTNAYGKLYTTKVWILGVRRDNRCYFAYSFASKRFYGHGDVETISPFLLIDQDDRLCSADVDTLRTQAQSADQHGLAPREVFTKALRHPNEEVRAVAAEVLNLLDANAPAGD